MASNKKSNRSIKIELHGMGELTRRLETMGDVTAKAFAEMAAAFDEGRRQTMLLGESLTEISADQKLCEAMELEATAAEYRRRAEELIDEVDQMRPSGAAEHSEGGGRSPRTTVGSLRLPERAILVRPKK